VGGSNFTSNSNGYCKKGYTGPLCDVCEDGHFFDAEQNACTNCDTATVTQLLLSTQAIFLFCFILMTSAYCIGLTRRRRRRHRRSITTTAITDTTTTTSSGAGRYSCSVVVDHFFVQLKKFKKMFLIRAKALWSFYQVAVSVGFNCAVRFPADYETVIASLQFVNVDLVSLR
jgi:hypothetical protein